MLSIADKKIKKFKSWPAQFLVLVALFITLLSGAFILSQPKAYAADNPDPACKKFDDPNKSGHDDVSLWNCEHDNPAACLQFDTSTPDGQTKFNQCLLDNAQSKNPLIKDIRTIVDFLSAAVGILVIGVILIGGIRYIAAGDNEQGIKAAKSNITNGLIAFFIFLFIEAFLVWLLPTDIFNPNSTLPAGAQAGDPCQLPGANKQIFFGFPHWWQYLNGVYDTLGNCVPNIDFPRGLFPIILAVLNMLLFAAGLVAVASFIIAGLTLVVASGNKDRAVAARKRIVNSLIGLAIVLVATSTISFIGRQLGG